MCIYNILTFLYIYTHMQFILCGKGSFYMEELIKMQNCYFCVDFELVQTYFL